MFSLFLKTPAQFNFDLIWIDGMAEENGAPYSNAISPKLKQLVSRCSERVRLVISHFGWFAMTRHLFKSQLELFVCNINRLIVCSYKISSYKIRTSIRNTLFKAHSLIHTHKTRLSFTYFYLFFLELEYCCDFIMENLFL